MLANERTKSMRLKRKIAAILGTVLLGAVGAVAVGSPALAYTYGPDQFRHISQYCVEMPGGPGNFGGQLILNYCGGPASHNQHIVLNDTVPFVAWQYTLQIEGSPYCLVAGNSDLFLSTIVQWTCDPTSDRFKWLLTFPNGVGQPTKRGLSSVHQPAWCIDKFNPTAGSYLVMDNCSTNYYDVIPA